VKKIVQVDLPIRLRKIGKGKILPGLFSGHAELQTFVIDRAQQGMGFRFSGCQALSVLLVQESGAALPVAWSL
jgi:hypothetical protein